MNLQKATLYEQYRLPYASEMVDDLMQQVGQAAVVADIGAGTGQLARLFAPRCDRVYAVEPDTAMREVAAEALKAYPNIEIIPAAAEATTLPDHSVDLIVIGNAYHRFRPEAVDELHRILKPSGWIAVISYNFTNQAFADMLFPRLSALEGFAARSTKNWYRLPVDNLFSGQPMQALHYAQTFTENWAAFWGSAQSGIEAPEPADPDFAQFQAINWEVFDAFSVDGQFEVAYETHVFFGQP